jgi:hypothetical protein
VTSLIDRAERLQAQLVGHQQQELGAHVRDRVGIVAEQTRRVTDDLVAILATWDSLSETELSIGELDRRATESAESGRSRARTTATRIEKPELSGPEIIGLVDGKGVQDAISAATEVAKRAAATIGKALEKERLSLCPAEIDEAVPDVPGNDLRVVQLRNAQTALGTPVTVTVDDILADGPGEPRRRRKKIHEAAEAWAREYPTLREALERESPAMRVFIETASTEDGAPLHLLTAEVLDRLTQDNRLDAFRVRPL